MSQPSAIEEVEIKEERHDYVFDDSDETGKTYPKKRIKMEEYESNEVRKLLDTQNMCLSQIDKISQQKMQEQPDIFCCYFCKLKFETKRKLKKHLLMHAVTKPCVCDISQKGYLQYYNEKTFKLCETCNFEDSEGSRTQNEGFRRHSKKQFFCGVCDYKFTRNSSLQVHLRIHSGYKPFSCEICDYKCTDKRNLQRHLRIHTGEKPYLCTMCNYKCADKSSLRIHLRIHTGEKPFVCEYCDYKSIDKRNLRRHLAIHTGEKPHSCKVCNYKTVNKRNLQRHLKVHKFTSRKVNVKKTGITVEKELSPIQFLDSGIIPTMSEESDNVSSNGTRRIRRHKRRIWMFI